MTKCTCKATFDSSPHTNGCKLVKKGYIKEGETAKESNKRNGY